jgi:predicted transglutaminase-like cysteine proteinase
MYSILLSVFLAVAPLQWQIFAIRHPQEVRTGKSSVSLATLKRINDRVNSGIISANEVGDTWSIWPHMGDCDDYAITKRHELLKRGVASRLAVVRLKDGQYHVILIVGDYVLDNLRKDIIKRNAVTYRFVMEQTANPNKWVKL